MKKILTPSFIFVALVVLLAAASRIMPAPFTLPPNFTPVLAMGIFAGAVVTSFRTALLMPLVAMLLSDLVIGFHSTMWAVYLCIIASTLLGYVIRNKQNILSVAGVSIGSAVLFFLVTNFAVWLNSTEGAGYSKDAAGLAYCYEMALPFFRNTLLSTLVFAGVMFGSYYTIAKLKPALIRVRKD